MDAVIAPLANSLTDPAGLVGHFTYVLLIISMLMRRIAWLRAVAVAAGLAKIVYRTAFVFDPISILWETVFVLVNVIQLLVLWSHSRPPRARPEEKVLLDTVAPRISAPAARALLRAAEWRDAAAGEALTVEGQPVGALIFIVSGTVDILTNGRLVARCGAGDFLGEMTWPQGERATATALAEGPVRYARFERGALAAILARREVLRYALQASISRNLAGKLVKTTHRSQEMPAAAG